MKQITEGKARIRIHEGTISKALPVFYNSVMQLNRDITVALLDSMPGRFRVLDLLAGSGIRSIRLLKELPKGKVIITANDANPLAAKAIKFHAKLNKAKFEVKNMDANELLASSGAFDYIDIDPFGSPNPFLDQSIQHLSRKGILAVTATDIAALAGTVPKACERKYWATPLRNYFMHETGLRILIRKCQLIGAQYERALTPILAYASQHYYRIFFKSEKGRQKADELLSQHKFFLYCKNCMTLKISARNFGVCECEEECEAAGPLWTGKLSDKGLLEKMRQTKYAREYVSLLADDSAIPVTGFLDIHQACRLLHISAPPTEKIINAIRKKGHKVALSHLSPTGLRTTMKGLDFLKLLTKRL